MVHICQYLTTAAADIPQNVVTICDGRRNTAQQLLSRVAALAVGLRQDLQVGCGEVVLLALDSTDLLLEALLAVTAAGAIAAPINLRWSLSEAAQAAQLCQARALLVDNANKAFLQLSSHPSCRPLQLAVHIYTAPSKSTDYVDTAMISKPLGVALELHHAPSGAAIICFTSGTTGNPKGVLISHSALHFQALAKINIVGYNASDIYLHAAPLFHIGGLSSALAVLLAGGTHVFMPKWSPFEALDAITKAQVTAFIAVPAMITDVTAAAENLARRPGFPATTQAVRYRSVQRILVGAGGMSQALQLKMQTCFPNATVHSAYGMTEACSSMTFKFIFSSKQRLTTTSNSISQLHAEPAAAPVCVPPPGIQMAVLALPKQAAADAQEEPLQITNAGEGELLTRGPHVMTQYWRQPTETQAVMLPGGWLRTGDIGAIDGQGQIWLTGRVKDVIRSGGESVHAAEVERVLCQARAVRAAAVFGLRHERFGAQVAAVIVLDVGFRWTGLALGQCPTTKPNATMPPLYLKQFCQQIQLSTFKFPRIIAAQFEPLPLNASGKVVKSKLKQAMLLALGQRQQHHGAKANDVSKL